VLTTILVATSVLATALLATPAHADREAPAPSSEATLEGPDGHSLDLSLKLGPNGFRFGTRLFGRDGYAGGAWLNGETRRDGFSVDGRVEHGGQAHRFRFDADIDAWVRRALRGRGVTDL
jgi:hypothetical protein